MLDRLVREKWLTAKAVAGIWPCRRDGDDVLVFADEARSAPIARLPMLRQQIVKREGRENACLADFLSPEADWIGGFAVTTGHGIEPHLAAFKAAHDDFSDILLKALADRFAEALAEALHFRMRTEIWGHEAPAAPDYPALIREQYRGIRPAPGYPACPDHSLKPLLFDLLDAPARTGITLTESFAMLPTAAVSGFYFAHPRSAYFGVARVGEDQLEEYAQRRGVSLDQARQWLRPNLD
jgi:5-methyltetrahydrofolate--homocysteine methyltransferase